MKPQTTPIKSAEEILEETILNYNEKVSQVYRFQFSKSENEMFAGMMKLFASLQTTAKEKEFCERLGKSVETLRKKPSVAMALELFDELIQNYKK